MPSITRFNTSSFNGPDGALGATEAFVKECVESLEPTLFDPPASGPGRPRVLPSLLLWSGMLVCVLRGFNSQLALWRTITQKDLWYYPRVPVTDEAVYKRLAKGSPLLSISSNTSATL
jgi:hypothetical protein